MEWLFYTLAFTMAAAITGSGVLALRWAIRRGQLRDFERNARVIFDVAEPEGEVTDFFPGERPGAPPRPPRARRAPPATAPRP